MTDSPYAALKIRDFRFLLAARLFVTVAVQIQFMAVGWQLYALTKSALYLGFLGLAGALPAITVALYAGHVADIVDRRHVALGAVLALTLSMALLAACSFGLDKQFLVPLIFVTIAITGFARGFYAPAIFGLISDIIPRELYANAAAWTTTMWQGSAIAGPVLGGILYGAFGPGITYSFSTALILGSLFCFVLVKARSEAPPDKTAGAIENIKEGLRFVFSNQIIVAAMALDLFAVLFGGVVALLPIFSSEVFHADSKVLGLLRAAPAVGAVLSAVCLTQKPIKENAGVIFMFAAAGFGVCMIMFGLSSNLILSLAILALSGCLDGISVYIRSTIFQLLTPNDMKGRVAAVNSIFIGSSNEIGEFESGVAARLLGLVPSVIFGGTMTVLVVLIAAIKAPKLRKLDMQTLYSKSE
ncbi:MAG: MFS transporter [Candidatus Obscuribacterales bacterium]|nr:MFS transporter [Candidatus Obscuribacterales bacterium]